MPAQVEGGVEAYGASLVGMPVLAVAFGKKGGWAHTVNSQTAYSVYRLTVRQPCPLAPPAFALCFDGLRLGLLGILFEHHL